MGKSTKAFKYLLSCFSTSPTTTVRPPDYPHQIVFRSPVRSILIQIHLHKLNTVFSKATPIEIMINQMVRLFIHAKVWELSHVQIKRWSTQNFFQWIIPWDRYFQRVDRILPAVVIGNDSCTAGIDPGYNQRRVVDQITCLIFLHYCPSCFLALVIHFDFDRGPVIGQIIPVGCTPNLRFKSFPFTLYIFISSAGIGSILYCFDFCIVSLQDYSLVYAAAMFCFYQMADLHFQSPAKSG